MTDIAKRLRQVLEAKGLVAERLAEMIGVASGTVSRWLSGDRTPSGKMLIAIQRALELPANWLDVEPDADPSLAYPQLSPNQNAAMRMFVWNGIPPEHLRIVVEGLAKQRFFDGFDPHVGYWTARIDDLLNEPKTANRRVPAEDVDLTQESPEVRGVRKRPRRL